MAMAGGLGAESLFSLLKPALQGVGTFPERRLGRALAFLTLYEVDQAHHRPDVVLDRMAEIVGDDDRLGEPYDEATSAAGMEYARELVSGVLQHREEVDRIIQERAPTWPLAQMSAIDRNVLRLGLYETLHGGAKVPMKAAINEAVEMAKLFGSETSAKFVNGVLGRAVERA